MSQTKLLSEQDEIDIRADLRQLRADLAALDNAEPMPHMVQERKRYRASLVEDIAKLEHLLIAGSDPEDASAREGTVA